MERAGSSGREAVEGGSRGRGGSRRDGGREQELLTLAAHITFIWSQSLVNHNVPLKVLPGQEGFGT